MQRREHPQPARAGAPLAAAQAVIRLGGLAGIAGPILFVASFTLLGLGRVGYDPLRDQISLLGTGPDGWPQNLSFGLFGLLLIVFARGLRQAWGPVVPGRGLRAGTALVALGGGGVILAGLFPTTTAWDTADGGLLAGAALHGAGAYLAFLAQCAAPIVLGRALRRVPAWRGPARYLQVAGWGTAALLVPLNIVPLALAGANGGLVGLAQRAFVVIAFSWCVVIGTRLLRTTPPSMTIMNS